MLEKVRKPSRAKNFIAYAIFGLICFVFVFMGIVPDQGGISGAGAAATVNDSVIAMQEFQEFLSREQGRIDSKASGAERRRRERDLRQGIIQRLVTFEVVYQYGVEAGILPVRGAVRDMIVNIPQFQENGRFQREYYDRYLGMTQTRASDFERKIARDVVIGKLQELFATAWKPSSVVERLDGQASGTKMEVDFVRLNQDAVTKKLTGAGALAEWLKNAENKKKVADLYEQRKESLKTPEEVHARHILIKGDDEKALARAKEIHKLAQSGDFASLAKEHSEDEGSKGKGGDLGFFGRGRMVPEFEDAAFSMAPGTISEPIKSDFGYHIIRLEEKRGGENRSLAQVENELAKELIGQSGFESAVAEFSERLKDKKSVDDLLKKYDLKWESTGEFNLKSFFIPKIESGEEAMGMLLANSKVGQVAPDLLAAGPNRYVLRLKNLSTPAAGVKESEDRLFFGGGTEVLMQWAEEKRKEARILINDIVLN